MVVIRGTGSVSDLITDFMFDLKPIFGPEGYYYKKSGGVDVGEFRPELIKESNENDQILKMQRKVSDSVSKYKKVDTIISDIDGIASKK